MKVLERDVDQAGLTLTVGSGTTVLGLYFSALLEDSISFVLKAKLAIRLGTAMAQATRSDVDLLAPSVATVSSPAGAAV